MKNVSPSRRDRTQGEEIYRTMVRSIEEKNKALLAENEELRKSLKQLSDNVAALQEVCLSRV